MGNYTIFSDVRKSYEWQTGKKFYNKSSENSRSQIVFRTDIFWKLSLGAPDKIGYALRKSLKWLKYMKQKKQSIECAAKLKRESEGT